MKHFIIFILLMLSISGVSQKFNIRNFGLKEGLPSPNVNSVCQDSEGYIWFATQNGISRFDGNSITKVNLDSSISSIDATFIMEDSKSRIWVGTTNYGAYYIENGKVSNFSIHNGLPSNFVSSLFEDSKGQVWFATDGGAAFFQNNEINVLMDKDSVLSDIVYCITETKNNSLWFGTVNNGLIEKTDITYKQYKSNKYNISDEIYSLCPLNKDDLIIGTTDSGIYLLSSGEFSKLKIPELEEAWISKSIVNENKVFFITSNGVIIYDLKSKSYEHITEKNGLVSNDLYSAVFDVNNNLWLTSGGNGVSVVRNENIQSLSQSYGLSSSKISNLHICSDSIIIAGTANNGLNLINIHNNNIKQFNSDELSNGISVVASVNNDIWVGGGLYSKGITVLTYDNSGLHYKKTIDTIQGIDINTIEEIIEDKKGNIWIATFGSGLFKISKTDTMRFSQQNVLSHDQILAFHIDNHDRAWVSIYNKGLYLLQSDTVTSINELFNLIELNVKCINHDINGNILLGNKTEGLTIIAADLSEVKHIKNQLISNHITEIEVDPDNNIWVGTDLGINRIKIGKNLEITEIKSITELNGLISSEIVKKGLVYSKGNLWAATPSGISKLKTSDLDKTIVKNNIALSDVKLFFEKVDWTKFDELEFDRFGIPKSLTLPYFQNHITFEFNTISINEQAYSYKLEGWDNEWTPFTSLNSAVYSNLQPGEYIFKVNSIDNFDSESANILEVPLIIYPPFWRTWWFLTIVVIISITILYLLFMLRTATLRKRQVVLEQTVEDRTKEVVAEKKEVELQKHLVEEKNQEISDSINYAERIQRSMLANENLINQHLNDYFIYFQPKDVVSGDFYWASILKNGKLALVNADSTGHGVPGAIMSMLNMNSLKEAVSGKELTAPHEILNHTRKIITDTLKNDGSAEGGKDGMDCTLMVFDLENNQIQFSAANNPVWVVRNGELIDFKGDKMPVGKHDRDSDSFTTQEFDVVKDDLIYTLTDGMPDQFGGPKGKKFMYKKLKNLLIEIATLPMSDQHDKLKSEMTKWMGEEEQVDDVCIIGVRV